MLTITEKGALRVSDFLKARGTGLGIRVKVTTTGCSGFAYGIEFADQIDEGDNVFEDKGVTIIVDTKSLIIHPASTTHQQLTVEQQVQYYHQLQQSRR